MRTPTPAEQQLSWWRARLQGDQGTGSGDETCLLPQPGYYKIRAKAWSKTWLPARVWLHQEIDYQTGELTEPEEPVVEIAGRTLSQSHAGAGAFSPAEEAWHKMKPVTMDEWKWLTARAELHSSGIAQQTSTSA